MFHSKQFLDRSASADRARGGEGTECTVMGVLSDILDLDTGEVDGGRRTANLPFPLSPDFRAPGCNIFVSSRIRAVGYWGGMMIFTSN